MGYESPDVTCNSRMLCSYLGFEKYLWQDLGLYNSNNLFVFLFFCEYFQPAREKKTLFLGALAVAGVAELLIEDSLQGTWSA